MARKKFIQRNGWHVGVFPLDHEIGFVPGRNGLRRNLIRVDDLAKLPPNVAKETLVDLYNSKQLELLNEKAKEREEKAKKKRERNRTTLKQAAKLWLKEVRDTQSEETYKRYKQSIDLYFSGCPDVQTNEFGRAENIKFYKLLAKTEVSKKPGTIISSNTQNKHMRHFQVFVNWCFNMEYMSRPFNLKKAPRPQKDPETFSEEDLDRLEKHLKRLADATLTDEGHRIHARKLRRNKNMYRAFMLARHTLLRSGAIWALQLDKFVLTGEEPFVRIRDCVVETKNSKGELKKTEWKSKKMKWPNKPLNSILLEFLKTDLANRKPIERYFLDDGRGYAWHEQTGKIARELKIEIEYLGLNIDLKPLHHGVRASGITWLLNQGVPPQTVQHLADHSNISTTMGYFNTRNASQSQAVNMLAKMGKTDKEEGPETTT